MDLTAPGLQTGATPSQWSLTQHLEEWKNISPEATSHVFFTSGSTGRPKGCIVCHQALLHYCLARNVVHGVDCNSACFVASAHTFDPSLGDLVATWATGGCVAYAPRSLLFSHLGSMLSVSSATHLCCTPSLFGTLSNTDWDAADALPSLSVV